ncbi:MAG TPA: PQQ-binding-like beta-propeller repeat protein [Chloroflexota bacterium]|nr:PQQ-binding-like beta-propeller repeat protein [Chloroflexota bacterium]
MIRGRGVAQGTRATTEAHNPLQSCNPIRIPLWAGPWGSAEQAQVTTGTLDWPYYGHDLGNMRYQDADQINPTNVANLVPIWVFHTGVLDAQSSFEVSPIVVAGTMYISTGHDDVFALDAATGVEKWAYHPEAAMPPFSKLSICCGRDNRGVAFANGKIFLARLDAVLTALDAQTGRVVWQAPVADWRQGFTMTMAPQVIDRLVIVGISGGEYLSRGAVVAFDAETGRRVWQFDTTLPGGTWADGSWARGGAPVWSNPSVDPRLGLIYVPTGNAAPDLNGFFRAGQNLYTASIVALDVRSGQEFIVNAFGGNTLDNTFQYAPLGDALVAFALPPPGFAGPRVTYADSAPQSSAVHPSR